MAGRTSTACGLTFYYLLTARRPFPKGDFDGTADGHPQEKPEPIAPSAQTPRPELVNVVDRMTAKSPAERFHTAQEVAQALRAWLRVTGGGIRPGKTPWRAGHSERSAGHSEHSTGHSERSEESWAKVG